MKNTCLLIVMFLSCQSICKAQYDDCVIYTQILKFLIENEKQIQYGDTGIVSSTDTVFHIVKITWEQNLNCFIIKNKKEFQASSIKNSFLDSWKDTSFLGGIPLTGYNSVRDSIVNCNFDNNIKYTYIEFKDK